MKGEIRGYWKIWKHYFSYTKFYHFGAKHLKQFFWNFFVECGTWNQRFLPKKIFSKTLGFGKIRKFIFSRQFYHFSAKRLKRFFLIILVGFPILDTRENVVQKAVVSWKIMWSLDTERSSKRKRFRKIFGFWNRRKNPFSRNFIICA